MSVNPYEPPREVNEPKVRRAGRLTGMVGVAGLWFLIGLLAFFAISAVRLLMR